MHLNNAATCLQYLLCLRPHGLIRHRDWSDQTGPQVTGLIRQVPHVTGLIGQVPQVTGLI